MVASSCAFEVLYRQLRRLDTVVIVDLQTISRLECVAGCRGEIELDRVNRLRPALQP